MKGITKSKTSSRFDNLKDSNFCLSLLKNNQDRALNEISYLTLILPFHVDDLFID